jgi:hypothetical protein
LFVNAARYTDIKGEKVIIIMEMQRTGGDRVVSDLFALVATNGRLSDEYRAQIRQEILEHFRGPRAADCRAFAASEATRRILQRLGENGPNPTEGAVGAAIEHIWHGGRLPRGLRITLLMWLLGELGPPGRRAWSDRRVHAIQGRGGPHRDEVLYRLGTEMRPIFTPFLDVEDMTEMAGDARLVGTGDGNDASRRPLLGPELGLAFRVTRASERSFDMEDCDKCLEDWQPDVLESLESLSFYFGHDRAATPSDGKMAMDYWNRVRRITRQGIHGASNLRRLTIEACDAAIFEEITLALADAPFVLDELRIQGVVNHRSDVDLGRATLTDLAHSPALRGLRRLTVVPYGVYEDCEFLPGILIAECGQTLEILEVEMFNSDRTSVSFVCTPTRDRCS